MIFQSPEALNGFRLNDQGKGQWVFPLMLDEYSQRHKRSLAMNSIKPGKILDPRKAQRPQVERSDKNRYPWATIPAIQRHQ